MTGPAHTLSKWLGYLTHAEINFLEELARGLPDNPSVINIGAGCGTSAVAFIESRPDLILTTIDIQKESSPFGCLVGEENELKKSGFSYQNRYRQIHGDSKKVPWNHLVDMVFIDGDHSYEGCAGDINVWMPRIKKGGILAIHDYKKAETNKPWPEVDRAVDDLLRGKYQLVGIVDSLIAFRMPTISVIEGIWNMPANQLEYNLVTLTRQTVIPLEIIVVNASSDMGYYAQAEAICNKYNVQMIGTHLPQFNLARIFNIGIRASKGEYCMMTSSDQMFAPNFMQLVYDRVSLNTFFGAWRSELPTGFDVGNPDTLMERWDDLVAKSEPRPQCSLGTIICIERNWLEKVHGYNEAQTPYNFLDSNLLYRAQKDGLEQGQAIDWKEAAVLHVYHVYPQPYYKLGGLAPSDSTPVIWTQGGWGEV